SGVALLLTASLVAVGWIGYVQTAAALTQLQREQAETRRQRDLAEHRARELGKAEAKLRRQAEVERIARRSAESAEQRALAAQLYAEKSLYFNRINAAQAEWHANHLGITEQILDSLPAEFGDRWDQIRGWEWDYLKSLCHLDRLTVSPLSAILYAAALSP